jgi:hypothetical protein
MADGEEPSARDDPIARAWAHLEQHEAENPHQPYATALRLRRARPKASVASIARELNEMIGTRISPPDLTKILYDARRKYLDFYGGPEQ